MSAITSFISDRLRWAWNHPGKASIKAGQLVLSISCTDLAYQHLKALWDSGAVPCSCVCSYPASLDAITKIASAAGLVLGAYMIARYDFFKPKLPPAPIPRRIEAEVEKLAGALS